MRPATRSSFPSSNASVADHSDGYDGNGGEGISAMVGNGATGHGRAWDERGNDDELMKKLARASEIVGRFSSGLVGLLGDLVQGLVTLKDEGISHVSRCLEADIGAVSTATRNVAKPPPPLCTRQTNSAGKNVAEDLETRSDFVGDESDESDDSNDKDDDTGYFVVYHGKKHCSSSCCGAACEASVSRVAGVESSESDDADDVDADIDNVEEDDANVKADDGAIANIQASPVSAGDEPVIESQIMFTAASYMTLGGSGGGMCSQRGVTDTRTESATDSSMKQCGAQLIKALAYKRRRKNLKLPSSPRPATPCDPAPPSEMDVHAAVKQIVVEELGIGVAEKGSGDVIPASTHKKQVTRSYSGHLRNKSVLLSRHQVSLHQVRKKSNKVVKKVRFEVVKTRSSPRLRALQSQPAEIVFVDLEGQPTATSPVVVPEVSVTCSSPPSQADAAADPSQTISIGQLAAAATITVVVEEIAAATVIEEEATVDMQVEHITPSEIVEPVEETTEQVVEGSVPPVAGVIATESEAGEQQTAPVVNDVVQDEAVDANVQDEVHVAAQDEVQAEAGDVQAEDGGDFVMDRVPGDLTPPSFSLDPDSIFAGMPLEESRASAQLLFPTLQKLGMGPDDGHWYVLSLNLKVKRFEVLDSLREEDSPSLLEHATRYMNAIKKAWLISYKDSHKQIQDSQLVYIDVLKQENGIDFGFFTFMFLELWNGKMIPAFTHDQG
ncbi:hypothetical protein D1007_25631 [Hordeum vulgare]|nr:hypothetical protein D1007_25631 [Hordeum vulgare]